MGRFRRVGERHGHGDWGPGVGNWVWTCIFTWGAGATYLYRNRGVPDWWCQMVTVGYEQARGLRQKHQKASGYAISGSKTVQAPLAALFEAWADPKSRRWLKDWKLEVRKATPGKSMRITWVDRATHLDVNSYFKGKNKSLVSVQHSKLADAKQAGRMKTYWAGSLDRLAGLLQAKWIETVATWLAMARRPRQGGFQSGGRVRPEAERGRKREP